MKRKLLLTATACRLPFLAGFCMAGAGRDGHADASPGRLAAGSRMLRHPAVHQSHDQITSGIKEVHP